MFTLKQLKSNFTKFLFLEFKESGPQVDDSLKTQKETTDKLTPEQEKIKALQEKLEQIQATEKITKQTAEILYKGLTRDPSIKNDPEAKETIRLFEKYKVEFEKAKQVGKITQEELNKLLKTTSQLADNFEYNLGVEYNSKTGETKENELTEEKLKTISNREFLSISPENRLQYITKNHIDAESIANGSVDNIEFTFTFDGEFNKELYLLTTAGQVLPSNINIVSSGNKEYFRNGIKGEFFTQNGERLKIHEGTEIFIKKLLTDEELNFKNIDIQNKVKDYIEKNPDKQNLDFIIEEAFKRDIDVNFALMILGDKFTNINNIFERSVLVEEAFTDLEREKEGITMWNGKLLDNGKYPDEYVINVLQGFNVSNWKDKAKEYGVKDTGIKKYEGGSLELSGDLKTKTLNLIKKFEGFNSKSFWDYKQYTWGYGTKAPGPNMYISIEDATIELENKINTHYNLEKHIGSSIYERLNDNQKAALTSFIFNLGPGKIKSFIPLLKQVPLTNEQIANKIRLYNKAGGKTLSGLVRRRNTEANLFLS